MPIRIGNTRILHVGYASLSGHHRPLASNLPAQGLKVIHTVASPGGKACAAPSLFLMPDGFRSAWAHASALHFLLTVHNAVFAGQTRLTTLLHARAVISNQNRL